jgi:hypothetical protein
LDDIETRLIFLLETIWPRHVIKHVTFLSKYLALLNRKTSENCINMGWKSKVTNSRIQKLFRQPIVEEDDEENDEDSEEASTCHTGTTADSESDLELRYQTST